MRKTVEERFWAKVNKTNSCWLWTAGTYPVGYGKFAVANGTSASTTIGAHRMAWRLTYGDPGTQHVLHRCDNRLCVNPAHLFLGTNFDNIADMVAKNRQSRGESSGLNTLTEQDVRAIRKAAVHQRQCELAAQYGVSRATICRIVNYRLWTHVT